MSYTGIGGFEIISLLLALLVYAVALTVFFGILYFVVREAVASGIRRARTDAPPRTPEA